MAITLVTSGSVDNGTTASLNAQLGLSASILANDLVVAQFSFSSTGGNSFIDVHDNNAGGAYTAAVAATNNTAVGQWAGIYYFYMAGAASSLTVTASWSVSNEFGALTASIWRGIATSNPVDGAVQQQLLNTTNPTSTSVTTTAADLVVGNVQMLNLTPSVGSGFTILGSNTSTLLFSEYLIQSAAGSVQANWTAASDSWTAQMAAFLPIAAVANLTYEDDSFAPIRVPPVDPVVSI